MKKLLVRIIFGVISQKKQSLKEKSLSDCLCLCRELAPVGTLIGTEFGDGYLLDEMLLLPTADNAAVGGVLVVGTLGELDIIQREGLGQPIEGAAVADAPQCGLALSLLSLHHLTEQVLLVL